METYTFKLLTGIECEIRSMRPKHQNILYPSKKSNTTFAQRCNEIFQDCIVRLGSDRDVTIEKVASLLSGDRGKILIELRNFTLSALNPEDVRRFTYTFSDESGRKTEQEFEFPETLAEKPYPFQVEELAELDEFRSMYTQLPVSKKKVTFRLLDGVLESQSEKNENNGINIGIEMRQPREFKKNDDTGKPIFIKLDLNSPDLPLVDLEVLRSVMAKYEGKVDYNFTVTNPLTKETMMFSLITVKEFFFPSLRTQEISATFGKFSTTED